jgi:hypothetical protein
VKSGGADIEKRTEKGKERKTKCTLVDNFDEKKRKLAEISKVVSDGLVWATGLRYP